METIFDFLYNKYHSTNLIGAGIAKRSKDIDSTFIQIEILRIMPKFPHTIDTHKIHQHLIEQGFEWDLRSTQCTLKMLTEHFELI